MAVDIVLVGPRGVRARGASRFKEGTCWLWCGLDSLRAVESEGESAAGTSGDAPQTNTAQQWSRLPRPTDR